MILVADSGSTKTSWMLAESSGRKHSFQTIGLSPFFHTIDSIQQEIRMNKGLMKHALEVTRLHFYGTGISNAEREKMMTTALSGIFAHAKISVDHDIKGAAQATCGNKPGISCILGTGSNACFFDGRNTHAITASLGYALGDEGSGAWFGKEFIRLYLYKELPEDLSSAFAKEARVDKDDILDNVYNKPRPNAYLASFSAFLGKHRNHPWVHAFVLNGFVDFLEIHVCRHPKHRDLPVHFVGSVAYHFSEILAEACREKHLELGVITDEPITGLFEHHTRVEN
jgi:N-acetylglucosamine kinase-like BadF-type ATPase